MVHIRKFFESRLYNGNNKNLKNLCNIDVEDIENIFQDILDEFPSMKLQVDSIPIFHDKSYPLMISLLVDKNFRFRREFLNKDIMENVLMIVHDIYLNQVNGRLSDYGLKIRDIRNTKSIVSERDGFFKNIIVIRVVDINYRFGDDMKMLESSQNSEFEKLYDEVKSLIYILEDENFSVSHTTFPQTTFWQNPNGRIIEIIFDYDPYPRHGKKLRGESELQSRVDAIKEFYDRCEEICNIYGYILTQNEMFKTNKTMIIIRKASKL